MLYFEIYLNRVGLAGSERQSPIASNCSFMFSLLGSFNKPETVHNGPDPSNDECGSGGLTPTVHEGHAVELVAIAASRDHGTVAGENAVQNEAAFGATGGELDHGGPAA